jgi:hypothetical protein
MSDKLFTVSLKGASQNQPWIVVNADTAQELDDALRELTTSELLQLIADANATYQGIANVANPSGRAPAPSAAGSDEPAQGSETTTPARQRGSAAPAASGYGRKKAVAGTGGRGGKKPKLSYEEASADCVHGERRRFTKPGADWVAYFCPQPKGQNECEANFIDASEDQES